MSRLSFVALLAAAVLAGAPAQAQRATGRAVTFGIAGGGSMPTGELADVAHNGVNMLGFVSLRAGRLPVALRAELRYDRFGLTRRTLTADGDAFDFGNVRSLAGTLDLVYTLPIGGRVAPYLVAGGGVYDVRVLLGERFSAVNGERSASTSNTNFGGNAGAGVRFPLGRLDAFAESRLHSVATDGRNTTFVPLSVGVTF
jgi:opacity protein-like surface antigen